MIQISWLFITSFKIQQNPIFDWLQNKGRDMIQEGWGVKCTAEDDFIFVIILLFMLVIILILCKRIYSIKIKRLIIDAQRYRVMETNLIFKFRNFVFDAYFLSFIENKYNSTVMNQRSSHFTLGTTSQNYGSVYAKDFAHKQPDPNDSKGPNPFRSTSLNSSQKPVFTTTNKMLYRAWQNVQKAKLNDDKLHELKTHHFKLGSYNPNQVLTTNKIYYDRKQITGEAAKTQEESKNKMRAHNHDFKQQNFTNYKSSYANQYTQKEGQYAGKVGDVRTDNAIVFGNHQIPMVTTSNASFTPKSIDPPSVKIQNQSVQGINLGDKHQPMETINQHYYNKKEIIKSSLPQSTMRQLRNTHFNLGLMPQQYHTENDHYSNPQNSLKQTTNQLTYQIPVYESGTWVDKEARFNSATTNKKELPARDTKPFERAVQVTRSGIDLGGHSSNYKSEFKDGYTVPTQLDKAVLGINRKSNVVIGSDSGSYVTEHKSSYKTNDLAQAKVNIDIKKLSKEDHFHIGGSTVEPKVTIYQDEHRPDHENRNKVFHRSNV